MKASISFPELQNIIAEKANQQISLAFVDGKTVRVSYPLNLGFIKKDISANLIIKELTGSDLLVQISAGMGTDTMVTTVLSLLKDKIPAGSAGPLLHAGAAGSAGYCGIQDLSGIPELSVCQSNPAAVRKAGERIVREQPACRCLHAYQRPRCTGRAFGDPGRDEGNGRG